LNFEFSDVKTEVLVLEVANPLTFAPAPNSRAFDDAFETWDIERCDFWGVSESPLESESESLEELELTSIFKQITNKNFNNVIY
jgi:lipopolysaccharide biosynthesis protein